MLLADKGYDSNALRNAVIERKAWANIPPKANRKAPICFSPFLYKARNLVERFFNKAKPHRDPIRQAGRELSRRSQTRRNPSGLHHVRILGAFRYCSSPSLETSLRKTKHSSNARK
jgi:transposase